MKTVALLTTLILCGCAGSPEGQAGTCQQSGKRADQPSPADAECAIETFLADMSTWTTDDLKKAAPGVLDPGKYDVMMATLKAPDYQAIPEEQSEEGMRIKVYRVNAQPLLYDGGQIRAAAATRLGPGATSQAIILEKNRYIAEQIEAGRVPAKDFFYDVDFRWEGQQWAVNPTPELIKNLTQP